MKTFDCLTNYNTENLAINIDLTSIKSFNSNNLDDMISINKWSGSKTSDVQLDDYGLTMYDNGMSNNMMDCKALLSSNNKLQLKRAKYNDLSGNTSYLDLDVQAITGTTSGTYIYLNGGYFQNYFKLFNYEHEVFPARYNLGITIENLLNITSGSTGIFYTMGTRSEDKYNDIFSGETTMWYEESVPQFSGVTTSEGNNLNAYNIVEHNKSSFNNFSDMKVQMPTLSPQINNISNNIISFGINLDKQLFYRYIDIDGNLIENYSDNKIINLGWNLITITFQPNELIFDYNPDNYLCYERRKGTLTFYVNGKQFWKLPNFDEFYFKQLDNTKEKMIGVPFNISWGGGSYGLKHSYHYDYNNYTLFENNDQNHINSGFTTSNTGITLTENNTTFVDNLSQPISVIQLDNANSGETIVSMDYNQQLNILPNRVYEVKCNVTINGGYISSNKIGLSVVGNNNIPINVIETKVYDPYTDLSSDWIELNIKFNIEQNCLSGNTFNLSLDVFDNSGSTITNTPIYIKDLKYYCQDILVIDGNKNGLMIEKYFNEPFIGGIQKLRVYDRALSSNEVFGNAFFESKNNRNLNLNIVKGGRIITI